MCFGPANKAHRAPKVLGAPSLLSNKSSVSAALEANMLQNAAAASYEHMQAAQAAPLNFPSPQNSDWSSPTLNEFEASLNNHMMSHEVLAAFHGNDYSTIYDDKTAAALGAAMLEANGFELSPELIDAVTPFLAANMQYNPMVAENDSPAVEMQFFPDVNDFDAQPNGLKVQPMDDFYANTSAPQIPFPNVAIKRSGDLEAEGPSSFEDSDESDEEYQEPGRKAGSKRPLSGCKSGQKTGANAAAKKPRTRPPNADDILLHTDPALVEKMLVPVRKRRQPKTMDPSLPPEVVEKRIKNTEAARRSRLRKTLKMDQLEHRVTDLEKEKEEWMARIAALERERDEWKERCQQLAVHVQGR